MNEQLLQQLLGLLLGSGGAVGGLTNSPSLTGVSFSPPSGGLQVPVQTPEPDAFSVEPDELAANAQNVSLDTLLPSASSGYGSPSGSPASLQSGPGLFGGAGGAAGALGGPSGGLAGAAGALESPPASGSDFDFKAAGNVISSAMNSLASGIAKQGQQASDQALKLMMSKQNDPRLQALTMPTKPVQGIQGSPTVGDAALMQLLSLLIPQGG